MSLHSFSSLRLVCNGPRTFLFVCPTPLKESLHTFSRTQLTALLQARKSLAPGVLADAWRPLVGRSTSTQKAVSVARITVRD
jgi:hypothetical protein